MYCKSLIKVKIYMYINKENNIDEIESTAAWFSRVLDNCCHFVHYYNKLIVLRE